MSSKNNENKVKLRNKIKSDTKADRWDLVSKEHPYLKLQKRKKC